MEPVLSIRGLTKTYKSGLTALKPVDLEIARGEIFALLGPNGAGKSTLINITCGLVTPSGGTVVAMGHDILKDYKAARRLIGLVPQEMHIDVFERVIDTVTFSRGLFGRPKDAARIQQILTELTLWDKRNERLKELSGGMKRRVMIAKALAHDPEILFLDEPTAGVDVELRRDMWNMVRRLRESGVTIILTTHYIEEAEEMADRVGVISRGELILVEEKTTLMQKLGKKELTLSLTEPLATVPPDLQEWNVTLNGDGTELHYMFDATAERTGVPSLLRRVSDLGIGFKDLSTKQSSLEDIFVSLVSERRAA